MSTAGWVSCCPSACEPACDALPACGVVQPLSHIHPLMAMETSRIRVETLSGWAALSTFAFAPVGLAVKEPARDVLHLLPLH